ncbi:hypothetical protein FRB99_006538 [Tulasnella sp. 403]|nr:hypothetical protein FRB99_006538 [Tulasnella sp. 403]
MLAQCPDLSELHIKECHFEDTGLPNHPPARLEFPHLRNLELARIRPLTAAYSILSQISSPTYDHFHLVSGAMIKSELPLGDPLPHLSHVIPSLSHLVAPANGIISINLRSYTRHFSMRDAPYGRILPFQLEVMHRSPTAVLQWLIAGLGHAMQNVATDITFDRSYTLSQLDIATIGRIPFVTKLCIYGISTRMIQYLSSPILVEGTQHWPLPRLASLYVNETDTKNLEDILAMVKSRYGHGAGLNAKLPSPFECLSVDGARDSWDCDVFDKIGGIVGKDHLKKLDFF